MEKGQDDKSNGKNEEEVYFDLRDIKKQIKEKGEYIKDKNIVKYVLREGEKLELKDESKLLARITNEKFIYTGFLNNKFERNLLGVNKYSNGDIYFGHWLNNVKHNQGIYIYNSNNIEIYNGNWENNNKTNFGVYIWSKGGNFNEKVMEASFDSFIGYFSNANYTNGLYISQTVADGIIKQNAYFGNFTEEGKKEDNNAYYLDLQCKMLFIGTFNQDTMKEGNVFQLNEEGVIDNDIFYFKKVNSDETEFHEFKEDEKEPLKRKATSFVQCFTSVNFFEQIWTLGHDCISETNVYNSIEHFINYESVIELDRKLMLNDLKEVIVKLTNFNDLTPKAENS